MNVRPSFYRDDFSSLLKCFLLSPSLFVCSFISVCPCTFVESLEVHLCFSWWSGVQELFTSNRSQRMSSLLTFPALSSNVSFSSSRRFVSLSRVLPFEEFRFDKALAQRKNESKIDKRAKGVKKNSRAELIADRELSSFASFSSSFFLGSFLLFFPQRDIPKRGVAWGAIRCWLQSQYFLLFTSSRNPVKRAILFSHSRRVSSSHFVRLSDVLRVRKENT